MCTNVELLLDRMLFIGIESIEAFERRGGLECARRSEAVDVVPLALAVLGRRLGELADATLVLGDRGLALVALARASTVSNMCLCVRVMVAVSEYLGASRLGVLDHVAHHDDASEREPTSECRFLWPISSIETEPEQRYSWWRCACVCVYWYIYVRVGLYKARVARLSS